MRSIHLSATFFTFCRLCRALDEALQPGITHFSWPVLRHSAALLGTHHYKCNTQLAVFPENCGKKWTLRRWAYGMFIARQLCSERLKLLLTRLASSHRFNNLKTNQMFLLFKWALASLHIFPFLFNDFLFERSSVDSEMNDGKKWC